MTQINLFMKQKQTHRHRDQTCGCQGGGGSGKGSSERLRFADVSYYIYPQRMDKQQGSTARHKELHSISYDKAQQRRIF